MPSFYETLGFKRSPFFRDPLQPTEEDFNQFVGRTRDVKKFMIAMNPSSGVHLVTGRRGVGKTSFVNAMQYLTSLSGPGEVILRRYGIEFYPENMLPNYKKIQLEDSDSVDRVLLRAISSIVFSADEFIRQNQDMFRGERLSNFHRVRQDLQDYTKESVSRAEQFLDTNAKQDLLRRTIEAVRGDLKRKGIYLTIDNLDILELETSTRLLNELRDYLFVEGLCIVMLGQEGLYTDLRSTEDGIRVIDRLSGQETVLDPLSKSETLEILSKRRVSLAIDPNNLPQIPLEDRFIEDLYTLTNGQIRLLFKICESLTIEILSKYPTIRVIKGADAELALKEVVGREVSFAAYSKKQIELLECCLKSPMRPKQYKELKLDSGIHFIRLTDRLIRDDLLDKRSAGSAMYYEPTGLLKLARHVGLI